MCIGVRVRAYMVQRELEGYQYPCEKMERLVTDRIASFV